MQSLFDSKVYNGVKERLNLLTPATQAQWGKMNVSQMLAHCNVAFYVPLSEKPMKRSILGLLMGWIIKAKLYNDSPWKPGLPTAPSFIIKGERNFDTEKAALENLVDQFYNKRPQEVGRFPHPMFGKFTRQQWGQIMFKHLDHHLRQFGV